MTEESLPCGMQSSEQIDDALTYSVIGAFFEVYNTLRYGFLERVYKKALERELRGRGHQVDREAPFRIYYKGEVLEEQRVDMLVDHSLVLEVKATYELPKIATRQLFNYLRATRLETGLLLHFGPEPKFYRITCRPRL